MWSTLKKKSLTSNNSISLHCFLQNNITGPRFVPRRTQNIVPQTGHSTMHFFIKLKLSGAFAKLRKAVIKFIVSVGPSVRTKKLGSCWTDFHEIWYSSYFPKIWRQNSSFIHIWQEWRMLYIKTNIHFFYLISLNSYQNEKYSYKSCGENQNTHFVFSNFSRKSCSLYEIMWGNTVQPDRPQRAIKYGTCALHVGT